MIYVVSCRHCEIMMFNFRAFRIEICRNYKEVFCRVGAKIESFLLENAGIIFKLKPHLSKRFKRRALCAKISASKSVEWWLRMGQNVSLLCCANLTILKLESFTNIPLMIP